MPVYKETYIHGQCFDVGEKNGIKKDYQLLIKNHNERNKTGSKNENNSTNSTSVEFNDISFI